MIKDQTKLQRKHPVSTICAPSLPTCRKDPETHKKAALRRRNWLRRKQKEFDFPSYVPRIWHQASRGVGPRSVFDEQAD